MKALGRIFGVGSIAALCIFGASGVIASPSASNAPVGPETSIPYGWVDFCQRYSSECANDQRAPQDIDLTESARRQIARINDAVNRSVAPVSDKEHFGSIDQWDYPADRKGDCEDYALLKRRMLIEAGFPREALLMTVVKDKNGDGHSVLTVKTNRGDYVLDNLTAGMRPWTSLPYRFVKRQSQENQNVWVAIGAPTAAPAYVSK